MAAEAKSRGARGANSKRRRKKRRTEDFSSDSDSSSSSDESSHETPGNANEEEQIEVEQVEQVESIDIDIDSIEQGETSKLVPENLSVATKLKLAQVPVTTSAISNANSVGKVNSANTAQVKSAIAKDRAELNNEYLKLFASEFSEDIDELRKKPDFTDKSLVILAKALQSGSNIFDDETLNALLNT